MLRRCLVFSVLLLFATFSVFFSCRIAAAESIAPDADTISDIHTLSVSIDYALSESRAFQIAKKEVELAEAKVKEARAALWPHLTVNGGYTFNGDLPTTVLDGNFPMTQGGPGATGSESEPIEIEMGAHHNIRGQVQVTYPLFTWGRLGNLYEQAVLGKLAAERALDAVQLDIELKVRQAFHGLLLAEAFVEVTEAALAQVEKRYKIAEAQKNAGTGTRLEVIRANVQVVNTRSQLIQAQNQRKIAVENLKLTLGYPLAQPLAIRGELTAEFKTVNIADALETALKNRPEVRQINLQEQIGETRLKVAKSGNKPMLSTFSNYTLNDSERQSIDTSWSAGVSIQIPIFDGFAHRAQVKQAEVGLDEIRLNKAEFLDGITISVKSAVFDLQAAEKLIDAQAGIVEQAAEGLRIANVQHEAGLITGVELTDVELSHTQAQVNRLQAVHDYIIAVARLERAIGARLE